MWAFGCAEEDTYKYYTDEHTDTISLMLVTNNKATNT